MALVFEMRKLAQNLLDDYDVRQAAVADLRSQVRQELTVYRAAHQAMTEKQQRQLKEHMLALRSEVMAAGRATSIYLKEINTAHQAITVEQQQQLDEHMLNLRDKVTKASQSTAKFLKETSQEHLAMTAEQQQWLTEQMDDLRRLVGDLRHTAAAFLSELDASHQSMAADLEQRLTGQRAHLASETAAFRADVSSAHQEMAAEQKQKLGEHQEHLRQSVEDLRRDAVGFIKDLDQAHQLMAAEQQQHISEERAHLMKAVTMARQQSQEEQQARRADQSEARQVWASIKFLKQQGRTHQESASLSLAAELPKEQAARREQPGLPAAPNLLAIRGIGPAMVQHLNAIGINTLEQLAANEPKQLRQALGKVGRLAKVEAWIAQAKKIIE